MPPNEMRVSCGAVLWYSQTDELFLEVGADSFTRLLGRTLVSSRSVGHSAQGNRRLPNVDNSRKAREAKPDPVDRGRNEPGNFEKHRDTQKAERETCQEVAQPSAGSNNESFGRPLSSHVTRNCVGEERACHRNSHERVLEIEVTIRKVIGCRYFIVLT
jgi:hypothetical protein